MTKLAAVLSLILSFSAFSQTTFKEIKKEIEKTSKANNNPEMLLISAEYKLFPQSEDEFLKIMEKFEKVSQRDRAVVNEVNEQGFMEALSYAYFDYSLLGEEEDIAGLISILNKSFKNGSIIGFFAGEVQDGRFWEPSFGEHFFSVSTAEGTLVFMIKGYM